MKAFSIAVVLFVSSVGVTATGAADLFNPQTNPAALNPQPLPPKAAVRLNPQPLPPKEAVRLNPQPLPPKAAVRLNPQPLPPKEVFR